MSHDLVARFVEHLRLTLEDRDERVGLVADLEEDRPDLGRALFAVFGEQRQLRARENATGWLGHQSTPPTLPGVNPVDVRERWSWANDAISPE